jgi:hypothetical protein
MRAAREDLPTGWCFSRRSTIRKPGKMLRARYLFFFAMVEKADTFE